MKTSFYLIFTSSKYQLYWTQENNELFIISNGIKGYILMITICPNNCQEMASIGCVHITWQYVQDDMIFMNYLQLTK